MVDSDQQTLVIDNLVPNTIYRACMRCRRELTDPFGDEKCEVVKTWAKSRRFSLSLNHSNERQLTYS